MSGRCERSGADAVRTIPTSVLNAAVCLDRREPGRAHCPDRLDLAVAGLRLGCGLAGEHRAGAASASTGPDLPLAAHPAAGWEHLDGRDALILPFGANSQLRRCNTARDPPSLRDPNG